MIPDRLLESGGTVVAVGRYVGTRRTTGRNLGARTVHIRRVQGESIAGFEQITDTLLVARAAEGESE
ncbi:MAG: hypothetical protein QM606_08800 [Leucobacter sp.]